MPAITLNQALSVFVATPLAGNELDLYFVEPPNNPLSRMITDLRAKRRFKVLFTGHRGNGKSTALNYLATQLQDSFFIVSFSVSSDLGGYDTRDMPSQRAKSRLIVKPPIRRLPRFAAISR